MGQNKRRYLPLLLTACIILSDQLSKAWIVRHIAENTVGFQFLGDFLAIVHVRNTAIAFSMGDSLPFAVKLLFFIIVPVLLVIAVLFVYFSKRFVLSSFHRWVLALFLGGGIGNLIDRIFRNFRVVDFISVKVYGFLGFERWPTWNIADASLVVSGILLAASIILESKEGKHV
ncbi:MAG: signal peptidase II [Sphaerochaeta sp.]|nr:signal peptidase II [Sphaerochaeta sp.]HAP56688.1 signal peptidase II [Sphaerochaeta sp.]HBO36362.1 signal peptidase II [Sphaerochaeta sp.]